MPGINDSMMGRSKTSCELEVKAGMMTRESRFERDSQQATTGQAARRSSHTCHSAIRIQASTLTEHTVMDSGGDTAPR